MLFCWGAHDTRKRYKELKRKYPNAVILLESGDDIYLTYDDSAEYFKEEFEKQYYTNAKNQPGLSVPRDWLAGRLTRLDAYAWTLKELTRKPSKVKPMEHKSTAIPPVKQQLTEVPPAKSCDNCQLRASGKCSQIRNILCEDYLAKPFIPRSVKETWPEHGDATAYRFGESRN